VFEIKYTAVLAFLNFIISFPLYSQRCLWNGGLGYDTKNRWQWPWLYRCL